MMIRDVVDLVLGFWVITQCNSQYTVLCVPGTPNSYVYALVSVYAAAVGAQTISIFETMEIKFNNMMPQLFRNVLEKKKIYIFCNRFYGDVVCVGEIDEIIIYNLIAGRDADGAIVSENEPMVLRFAHGRDRLNLWPEMLFLNAKKPLLVLQIIPLFSINYGIHELNYKNFFSI